MAYVKAEVPKEVQRALNIEAAKYDITVSEVAAQELEQWYNQSDYDIEINE